MLKHLTHQTALASADSPESPRGSLPMVDMEDFTDGKERRVPEMILGPPKLEGLSPPVHVAATDHQRAPVDNVDV